MQRVEFVHLNNQKMEKINMNKNLILALTLIFTLSATLSVMAMSHEKMDHSSMENHGTMENHASMNHDSMEMAGDTAMLGNDIQENVKAMAHLKDVQAAMAKMGMKETHHFMVMFVDSATGEPIEHGSAALKIVSPSGMESGPVKLIGMQGHFGADITLNEKGNYTFTVGTKLADGEKRQFQFTHTLK